MGHSSRQVVDIVRTYDLVILVSLLWFMVQFLRFVFPPLFDTFQSIYGVSNTHTGILFTALMVAYASVQFPAGVLGDRIGRPSVIVAGAIAFSTAALIAAVSPSFLVVFLAAVLIGLGTGPHKTVAIPLLSDQYREQKGRALGAMDTIGQFGGMVAPLVVVAVLSVFVWRGVFLLGTIVSLILVVLFFVRVRNDDELNARPRRADSEVAEGEDAISYLSVFADRRLLVFMLVTVLFTFGWNGLSSFFPLFLSAEKGLSSESAGLLYSLLFVASVSQAVTGDLSDRIGRLRVALLLFVGMFVGVTGLILVESVLSMVLVTLVIGVGFHGFRPVRDSYLMDVIPESIGGGTLGVIRTFMTGIGAFAPAIVGYLSDTVGFAFAFAVIGSAAAAAAFFVLLLR